jgi:hypothetical protein
MSIRIGNYLIEAYWEGGPIYWRPYMHTIVTEDMCYYYRFCHCGYEWRRALNIYGVIIAVEKLID